MKQLQSHRHEKCNDSAAAGTCPISSQPSRPVALTLYSVAAGAGAQREAGVSGFHGAAAGAALLLGEGRERRRRRRVVRGWARPWLRQLLRLLRLQW